MSLVDDLKKNGAQPVASAWTGGNNNSGSRQATPSNPLIESLWASGARPVTYSPNTTLSAFTRYKQLAEQNANKAATAYDQAKSDVGFAGWKKRLSTANQATRERKQQAIQAAGGEDYSGWATDPLTSAQMYGEEQPVSLADAWRNFLDKRKERKQAVVDAYKDKKDAEAQAAIASNPEAYKAQQKEQQSKQWQIDAWGRENGGWNATSLKKAQEIYDEADKKYNDIANGTAALDPTQDKEYQDYLSQAQEWGQRQVAEGEWQSTDYDNYMLEQEDIARQEYERRALFGGSQRYYSDTELTAAARERERAKMVLDYAQQHQYDELQNAPDFVGRSASGEVEFRESRNQLFANENDRAAYDQEMSAARDQADSMGLTGEDRRTYLEDIAANAYRNYQNKAANASQWDPQYNTAFQEPDERWTEEERQKFYYLYATDQERANQYGASINQKYNAEEAAEKDIATEEFATRNVGTAALATAGAVGGHLLGGNMDFARMAAENAYRGDLYETQYQGISRTGDVATSAIAQDLNNRLGTINENVPVLGGKGWGDVYQLFESMVESGASIAAGGEAGSLASFFGMAASSGTRDALERGLDSDKALLTGFINGVAEVAGEKFSVENLLSNKGLADFLTKGAFREILKQGGVEASEEVFTTLLNTMADEAINGNDSEIKAKIYAKMVMGMSREEAQKEALKDWINQLGQDALGGLLSGSVMAGGRYASYAAPAAVTRYQGNAQGLFDYADLMDENSRAAQTADRYRPRFERTGNISNLTAARLMAETEASGDVGARERTSAAVNEAFGSTEEARNALERSRDESNTEDREKVVKLAQRLGMQEQRNKPGRQDTTPTEQRAANRVERVVAALDNIAKRQSESESHTATKAEAVQLEDGGKVTEARYNSDTQTITVSVEDAAGNMRIVDSSELTGEVAETLTRLEDMLGNKAQAALAFNQMDAGQNTFQYGLDFAKMRALGQTGAKFDVALKNHSGILTEAQAHYAYTLGEGMTNRENKIEAKEALRNENEEAARTNNAKTPDVFTKRELHGKITGLSNELSRELTKPKAERNIPAQVATQAVKVLQALNANRGKAGEQLRPKLLELKDAYRKTQTAPDAQSAENREMSGREKAQISASYDKVVAGLIDNALDAVGDTPIDKLSASQIQAVYEALSALDKTGREALKIQIGGKERDAYKMAQQMIKETASVNKPKGRLLQAWLNAQLSPERMFNRLGGYHKNSAWNQVYQMLDEGQSKAMRIQADGSLLFENLLKDKRYKDAINPKKTVDIGLKDKDGKAIPITRGMMWSVYNALMDKEHAWHVVDGSYTLPDLSDYYHGRNNKGLDNVTHVAGIAKELSVAEKARRDAEEALREARASGASTEEIEALKGERKRAAQKVKDVRAKGLAYGEELKKNIEKLLTDYDRQWISALGELFDDFSKSKINETTLEIYGIKLANKDHYYPIAVDRDFLETPFENIAQDMSLENAGFVKERVNSGAPVYLFDASDVAKAHLRRVAQYCGLMPAIRDFQKIWGKVTPGFESSLPETVRSKFESSGVKYIENLMADLNGARRSKDGLLGEFFDTVRGNMAQSSLTLSARVAFGQMASYPTAASVVGWEALHKAFWHGGRSNRLISRADQELIRKHLPHLWYRTQGYSTTELGDLANSNSRKAQIWKKMRWVTGWIQAFDSATVGRLWYAAQYYVDDHNKALKKGTDAYYREVAKIFRDVIEKTQPNYTTMQRPDILRNPNALIRQLTMFLTQRLQNFNILYDAAATYTQMRKDLAAGREGVTINDVMEARAAARRAAVSQIVAAATITVFKVLADGLLHNMKAYRDDDEDLTAESISMEALDMFIDSLVGNMLWGGEIYDLVEKYAFGKTYYGLEVSGVSTLTDVISAATKFLDEALKEGATPKEVWDKGGHKLAKSIATLRGVPLANGEKIVWGLIYHATDIVNGEALSMEAGVERTTAQQAHRLYRAYTAANFGTAKKIREQVGDDKSLNQALTEYIKRQYKDGAITQSKAAEQLRRYAGKDAETATKTMREYSAEVETGIKYDDITKELLEGNLSEAEAAKMWQKYGGLSAEDAKATAAWKVYQDRHSNTRYSDSTFKSYYKAVRPSGVSAKVFEEILYGGDTDGNGKIKQTEAAAAIDAAIRNGTLTEQQAETVWKALGSTWKKSYAEYKAANK